MASSLNALEVLQLDSVPELNCSVLRATARRQQALLMRRPGYGFHCGLMVVELRQRLRRASRAPQHQLVVVAARSELLIVERPL